MVLEIQTLYVIQTTFQDHTVILKVRLSQNEFMKSLILQSSN
jgi:hypothetical protein